MQKISQIEYHDLNYLKNHNIWSILYTVRSHLISAFLIPELQFLKYCSSSNIPFII
jgi:hypothetical protein